MTQQCKYDDQLLDYLYGELDEPARKLFTEHLQSCSACAAQVDSLGRVRKEYQNRSPIEPSGEAMQRMTALLMQAAAAQAPATAGAAETQAGAKVLQFRSRGLRRILFHPAGGVMAVAAAALFWVVFRAQPGAHTGISGPTSFRTLEDVASETAAAPAVPAAVPVDRSAAVSGADRATEGGAELKEAQGKKGVIDEGRSQDGKLVRGAGLGKDKAAAVPADNDDDFGGLRAKSRPAKELDVLSTETLREEKPSAAPKPVSGAPLAPAKPIFPAISSRLSAKPSAGLALELRTPAGGAAAAGKGSASAAAGADPVANKNAESVPRSLDDRVYAKAEKKVAVSDAERWAQPPPPPPAVYASPSRAAPQAAAPAPVQTPTAAPPASPAPEPPRDEDNSVSGAIARTRDQRQQKVVEALANQELGSLGPAGNSGSAQSGDSHYGQHHAAAPKADSAAAAGRSLAQEPAESEAAPAATAPGQLSSIPNRTAVVGGNRDEGAAALAAVKDQLRRGQCAEANTALAKLERSQPTLPGLAQTRAEWQSSCAAPTVPQLERRLPNEALEAPAPASASRSVNKLRAANPAPAPAKAPVRAKAASKPAPERKAADSALQ